MTAIKLQPSKYSMIPFVSDSVISVVLNAVDRPCCLFIQKVLCTASNHETVHWHRRGGFIYQPISDHTLPFVSLSWPTKSTIHLYVSRLSNSLYIWLPVSLTTFLPVCLLWPPWFKDIKSLRQEENKASASTALLVSTFHSLASSSTGPQSISLRTNCARRLGRVEPHPRWMRHLHGFGPKSDPNFTWLWTHSEATIRY